MSSFVTHLESAIDSTELSHEELQTTHEGRPLWVRYDLDGIRVTGAVDATITSVEGGRIALLSPTTSGSVNLRRGDVGATLSWPRVGPGELRWCTSLVSTPVIVKDS